MSELFTESVSAGLLRVLAQAAGGYVDEERIYFVARYAPDGECGYDVRPFRTEKEAVSAAAKLTLPDGPRYAAFGPFDTRPPYPENPAQASVELFQITTTASNAFVLQGAGMYDALFCSTAAVMKFAVPYYTAVYSPVFAGEMLRSFLAAPLALMVHLPWSEYGEMGLDGVASVPEASSRRADDVRPPAWIPAVFEEDGQGGYRPRPIHPGIAPAASAAHPSPSAPPVSELTPSFVAG